MTCDPQNLEDDEIQRSSRRWRVRRRMAKTAFVAGLIYPLLCLYEPKLIELVTHFYAFVTGIIVVYIGGVTYEDTNRLGGTK